MKKLIIEIPDDVPSTHQGYFEYFGVMSTQLSYTLANGAVVTDDCISRSALLGKARCNNSNYCGYEGDSCCNSCGYMVVTKEGIMKAPTIGEESENV